MGKIIGIDLGTTNSCVSVIEGQDPVVIPNAEGTRTTPSIVGFTKSGEKLVGQAAKRQAVMNSKNTVSSIKRFMGRRMDEVANEIKRVPYKVVRGENDSARVDINGSIYSPPEISAMILLKMKQTAEAFLGEKVTEAVITVPAYFNDAQRQATKDAGKIAGLDVKRIVNEPTAAALAYGLDKANQEKVIAVYDFGGGTFDISILELGGGVFEVLATNGDTHLGGDDIDQVLIDYIADEFQKAEGVDIRKDPMALQRLSEEAEKAKIELSAALQTDVKLPYVAVVETVPKHIDITITRAKFEQLIEPLVLRSIEPCKQALADADITPDKIDEVILVGGTTRIPRIQQAVKDFFNKEPHKGVNPDEVVALGAAVQGGVLTGDIKDILLLDVCPLSLGIETMGGVMVKMIEANTTIPTKKVETYSTASDNQNSVEIHILQGERPMAQDNRTLGRFVLDGIPPAPRGVPQIEVTFDIDANGILHVVALDKATKKEQTVKITHSSGLSDAEIEKMKKDAKDHESEDKGRKETVDLKNQVDTLLFQGEKQLSEFSSRMSSEHKIAIETSIQQLKDSKNSSDIEAMKNAIQAFNSAWSDASREMYSNTSGDTQNSTQSEPESKPVDDADFEVVDDEKQ